MCCQAHCWLSLTLFNALVPASLTEFIHDDICSHFHQASQHLNKHVPSTTKYHTTSKHMFTTLHASPTWLDTFVATEPAEPPASGRGTELNGNDMLGEEE